MPRGTVIVSRAVEDGLVELRVTVTGLNVDCRFEYEDAVRIIAPENPAREDSVRVEFPVWPTLRARNVLLAVRVKSGPVTFSWMYAEWLRLLGPIPVTLTEANPGVVVDGIVTVRVVLACPPEGRLMLLSVRAALTVP